MQKWSVRRWRRHHRKRTYKAAPVIKTAAKTTATGECMPSVAGASGSFKHINQFKFVHQKKKSAKSLYDMYKPAIAGERSPANTGMAPRRGFMFSSASSFCLVLLCMISCSTQ